MNIDQLKKLAGFSITENQQKGSGMPVHDADDEYHDSPEYEDELARDELARIDTGIRRLPREIKSWTSRLKSPKAKLLVYKRLIAKLEKVTQQLKQDIGQ